MPRIIGHHVKLRTDIEAAAAWHALEQLQGRINIFRRVERLRVGVMAVLMNLRVQRVFLLQMSGVPQ